jgi:hypothetical protein
LARAFDDWRIRNYSSGSNSPRYGRAPSRHLWKRTVSLRAINEVQRYGLRADSPTMMPHMLAGIDPVITTTNSYC